MAVRRLRRQTDYWPAFVDVLTNLLLVFVFLLALFNMTEFFLADALSGKDKALQDARDQITALTDQLALEKVKRDELVATSDSLRAALGDAETRLAAVADQEARLKDMSAELDAAKQAARDAADAAMVRNDALAQEIAALKLEMERLNSALDASKKKDEEQKAVIIDLGKRLNQALAQKVEELAGFRSEFFASLKQALGDRADMRVVGDRFVFQSEVLFASGSAEIGEEGRKRLDALAATLIEVSAKIPAGVKWVLRVDGHTDSDPIATQRFPSNWELSAARAIAVVRYLGEKGVQPDRLAAAGFGEFQPLDGGPGPESKARNRRIEFKLTER